MKYAFLFAKLAFFPDIFKFIYFHFFGQVVVIGEEVNGEIFLKFRRKSIASKHESVYSPSNKFPSTLYK